MLAYDFAAICCQNHYNYFQDSAEWSDWRDCYRGGDTFLRRYLQRIEDKETHTEFERRKSLTPVPTYAKREINKVRNALFQRFGDIVRREGTAATRAIIDGQNRGVDNRGSSMNAFSGKVILPDLLVMSAFGVLVDAPRVPGETLADVPQDFRPYLNGYCVEQINKLIPQDPGKPGDWKAVLLTDVSYSLDMFNGTRTETQTYRYFYIDPDTGLVNVQQLASNGEPTEPVIVTDLVEIPFVLYDIGGSLIQDVWRHQAALLNLVSSDTNYAHDANFPFLTRQTHDMNAEHLDGAESEVKVGGRKGMKYGKSLERPQFIAPPADPLRLSIELRKTLKEEVKELVLGALSDMGEDGTIDSGLAFIGECMESAEQRVWQHWATFEQRNPSRRRPILVSYPEVWGLKSDEQRIKDCEAFLGLMFKVPGRKIKKEIAKLGADQLLRGKVKTNVLDSIKEEIDDAPYCTSDPDIVIPAKKEGLMSGETGSLALGGTEDEWEKSQRDQAERAAQIVKAQADAGQGAARGAPDLSVDPANARAEKEDGEGKLNGSTGGRGKGAPIPNLED